MAEAGQVILAWRFRLALPFRLALTFRLALPFCHLDFCRARGRECTPDLEQVGISLGSGGWGWPRPVRSNGKAKRVDGFVAQHFILTSNTIFLQPFLAPGTLRAEVVAMPPPWRVRPGRRAVGKTAGLDWQRRQGYLIQLGMGGICRVGGLCSRPT